MDDAITINLAYLILLVGALTTLFALLTPGTGFFELIALTALAIASWAMLILTINIWALILLISGIVPFVLAMRNNNQRLYLLLSVVALVVGSAYLFEGTEWWLPGVDPILAIIGSLSSGSLLWLMTDKVLEARAVTPLHDISDIIGATGEARTAIHRDGSVYVYGEMWTARSEAPIKSGTIVRIIGREGLILLVEVAKK